MINFFTYPAFLLSKSVQRKSILIACALGCSLSAQPTPGNGPSTKANPSAPPTDTRGIQGVFEVDPESGAASLFIPLGPGIGCTGLRYLPALVGRFAPQAGLAPSAFQLTPGWLDWPLIPSRPNEAPPRIRWTYPDGAGGGAMGACCDEPDPDEVLARFGYAKPGRPAYLPHLNSAPPGPIALKGAAGEWLFPLAADPEILADMPPAPEQEMADKDPWILPAGLVAIRENLAYEFGYAAPDRSGGNSRVAHYRLIAVRAPSGERVTFTYGPNGLDFEATWTDAKVQVALDALHPSETFRQVEARLRITYAGSPAAAQGYTVSILLGTDDLAPSEPPANSPPDTPAGAKAIPPAFRNPLQVVRVQEDGSGETVEFSYGEASAVSIAGPEATHHVLPTVVKEIAFPWRSLWLDWAPQPWPDAPARTGAVSRPESEWSFGVKAIYEKGAPTYMRVSPGSPCSTSEPPSQSGPKEVSIGSWVRQSRHFACAATPGTGGLCRTFVRDRWIFQGTNKIPNPEPTQRYRSFDCDFNGDIPTFEWDRQEMALVPVVGQMTRRLDWEPGTNLPPDLHRAGHQGKRMAGGLKGGNPGAAVPGINPGLEALKALAAQATAQGQRVLAEQEARSAARFAQMEAQTQAQIRQANARHQAELQAGMAAASAEYRKRQMENEIKDREEQLKKSEECLWQQTEELKQRSITLEQQTQELEKQAEDLRKQVEELIK